jgi:hypothetical protein
MFHFDDRKRLNSTLVGGRHTGTVRPASPDRVSCLFPAPAEYYHGERQEPVLFGRTARGESMLSGGS